jgi:hypothetical protein
MLNPGRTIAHVYLLHGRAKLSQESETGKGNNGISRFPVCGSSGDLYLKMRHGCMKWYKQSVGMLRMGT